MAKCTGRRCPMQVGYKVDECNHKDCPYRIYPITNADRIRSMINDELNELFHKIYNECAEDAVAHEWWQRTNSFELTMDLLQQAAEQKVIKNYKKVVDK